MKKKESHSVKSIDRLSLLSLCGLTITAASQRQKVLDKHTTDLQLSHSMRSPLFHVNVEYAEQIISVKWPSHSQQENTKLNTAQTREW